MILFKLIEYDNYFNNQSHLEKYKKNTPTWASEVGIKQSRKTCIVSIGKYFFSHNIEQVKILECTKEVWDRLHKIQTKFGLLRTLAIQRAALLYTCCTKFVNLKCVLYMYRTTYIVHFVSKMQLNLF